jgi:hypothetical protein
MMISENCSIDEFVEAVTGKAAKEVIALAIDEATRADRIFLRTRHHPAQRPLLCGLTYSRHLKELIGYLRYTVKPRRPRARAYQLYMQHWGAPHPQPSTPPIHRPDKTLH